MNLQAMGLETFCKFIFKNKLSKTVFSLPWRGDHLYRMHKGKKCVQLNVDKEMQILGYLRCEGGGVETSVIYTIGSNESCTWV